MIFYDLTFLLCKVSLTAEQAKELIKVEENEKNCLCVPQRAKATFLYVSQSLKIMYKPYKV